MSIQSQLNAQSLDKLKAIKSVISNSDKFAANQIKNATIRAMLDSSLDIDSMSDKQLEQFEDGLIKAFEFKKWI